MIRFASVVVSLFVMASVAQVGCMEKNVPAVAPAVVPVQGSWWNGVLARATRSSGLALEAIHDGTGWLLGKNKVEIEQVGDANLVDGKRLAKFEITVARSSESYSAIIDEIECDELGLPTEQSIEKMNEVVTKIKEMLDKLQS